MSGLSNDTQALMAFQAGKKSTGVAYLLWLFLGSVGGHHFYLKQNDAAFVMVALAVFGWTTVAFVVGLLFLVPLAIWLLIDLFTIPSMVAKFNANLMAQLNAAAAPRLDTADQIAKLAALKDSGALTQEEFDAQKAKLLS